MNVNTLKEIKLFFYKYLINIIFNHTHVNYIYKIIVIFLIIFFLSLLSIFINF